MPIMIPINVQEMPFIPMFDMNEYMSRVSQYASQLWTEMVREERAKFSSRRKTFSDDELSAMLTDCPDYASVKHDDMSQITKEEYRNFARSNKAMKGVEKWL